METVERTVTPEQKEQARRDHRAAIRILAQQYAGGIEEEVERDRQRLVHSLPLVSPCLLHVPADVGIVAGAIAVLFLSIATAVRIIRRQRMRQNLIERLAERR